MEMPQALSIVLLASYEAIATTGLQLATDTVGCGSTLSRNAHPVISAFAADGNLFNVKALAIQNAAITACQIGIDLFGCTQGTLRSHLYCKGR